MVAKTAGKILLKNRGQFGPVKGGQFTPAKLRNLKRRRGGTLTGISTIGTG
jgi:hypothetical protein